MGTKQETIQNNIEIPQAESDNIPPEERIALETLARFNTLREQAGLASTPREAKAAKAKSKPKRQLRKRPSRRKALPAASAAKSDNPLFAHESRCSICCHEDRDAIEEDFVHWDSPFNIANYYGVSERAVYCHAHALNLYDVRDRKLRFALGNIIERVDRIPMTPDVILKAIHAFARVNSRGDDSTAGASISEPPAAASRPSPPKRLPAASSPAQFQTSEAPRIAGARNSPVATQRAELSAAEFPAEPPAIELPATELPATELLDPPPPPEPPPAPRRFQFAPW
ncbi:MAG TPA: hypothetical protein VG322_14490 [Candidatus Acidoferrales bacterium]|jgi:hypothetical protein|nr:hypothetical protein [Candidatus Acidoferrales bacterium]